MVTARGIRVIQPVHRRTGHRGNPARTLRTPTHLDQRITLHQRRRIEMLTRKPVIQPEHHHRIPGSHRHRRPPLAGALAVHQGHRMRTRLQTGRHDRIEIIPALRVLLHRHVRGAVRTRQTLRAAIDVRVPEQAIRIRLPTRRGLQPVHVETRHTTLLHHTRIHGNPTPGRRGKLRHRRHHARLHTSTKIRNGNSNKMTGRIEAGAAVPRGRAFIRDVRDGGVAVRLVAHVLVRLALLDGLAGVLQMQRHTHLQATHVNLGRLAYALLVQAGRDRIDSIPEGPARPVPVTVRGLRVLRIAVQGVRIQADQRHVEMALQRARLRTRLRKRLPVERLCSHFAGRKAPILGACAVDALVILRRHLGIVNRTGL